MLVGRDAELELVGAALDAAEPPFSVLWLTGPGGIGKSSLLDVIAELAGLAGGWSVVRLDGRDVAPSASAVFNGSGTRCEAATREMLRTAGIKAEISGYVSDNHVLLQLVAAGHGVTIVPDLVLRDVGQALTVAHEPLRVTRTLLAVTRTQPTDVARRFVNAIRR